ncbi:MAG: hypothetical protein A2029_11210 [Chloroflexi bacterium RBG_19FT_COMBO_47_9]|nr:MAG: hypothetical protein A2029_11210 [Chloroflexi bacterium RBG_19FT_COMBO_47_9]
MSNDNIALFISFISLFASIIFGALNWLHTNKAFKATEYPVVGLEIMDIVVNHLDHRSYIKYKITNFSKELTVLNLVLIIKIAKPNNRNLLLFTKWMYYHKKVWNSISFGNPVGGEETENSIEDFLEANCPGELLKETPTYYANPPTYFLLPYPLTIRLDLSYQPSAFGIKSIRRSEKYTLTQSYIPDGKPEKLEWKIQRKK